jgi:hypothetical protein
VTAPLNGAAVCRALGLEPRLVSKLVLTFDSEANGVGVAEVTMQVWADTGLVDVIERFRLEPIEDGDVPQG